MIFEDAQGRVLLQKRTPDYEGSARIELKEELGITKTELTQVAHFYEGTP